MLNWEKSGGAGFMKIREIIKDALKYPLTDWKKIVILGIITYFSGIAGIAHAFRITKH